MIMVDVLTDLFRAFRMKANVFLYSRFYGSWAVDTSGQYRATFHVVGRGICWLHLPERDAPIPLHGGDVVVFPRDAVHTISSSPTPPLPHQPLNQPGGEGEQAGGTPTSLLCGSWEFDRHNWNPLIDELPDIMVVRREDIAGTALTDSLTLFLIFESENDYAGKDLVIDRLSEILLIHVIRMHMQKVDNGFGYLSALADRRVGTVINQIHSEPGAPWSVERMAKVAGMSRSAFAEKFKLLTGMTPMQYATCWRMQRAYEWFTTVNLSIALAAQRSGYLSEASFSKAFKNHFGFGPGAARKMEAER